MITLNELENQIHEFQVAMAREGDKYEQLRKEFHSTQQSLEGMRHRAEAAEAKCEQKASRILELDVAVHTERARAEATEAELAKVQTLIAEYISAYDNASDPQAVGSTCRLIRAESDMRDYLEDYK